MIQKVGYSILFLVTIVIFISILFVKVRVECRSQVGNCPDEMNIKLKSINSNYLFMAGMQASKILKDSFLVSNFSSQFKLPNILLINLVIKRPEYSILDKSQNKYFMIDHDGRIISLSESSNMPTILIDQLSVRVGDIIPVNNLFALQIMAGVYQMYQVKSGMIQNDTLVVDIPPGVRVIFPLEGDSQVLLGGLRLIYTKVVTDYNGKYSQIDMRYKNPVLR
jgi:hypothetical protein